MIPKKKKYSICFLQEVHSTKDLKGRLVRMLMKNGLHVIFSSSFLNVHSCREIIVLNPRVLQPLGQYYQHKHPYITFFQSNCVSTKHHLLFLPCLARKSASLKGHTCSNSPTGALMLTGNLLFSVLK